MTALVELSEETRIGMLASLGVVAYDAGCVVADEPSAITRHAHEPMPEAERQRWERDRLERHIAALRGRA